MGGHRVVSKEQFLSKIRAACDVRDEHDGDFVIAARSDAPGATNASTEDAVSRLNAAVDAGADLAFVIGQSSEEEVRYVGAEIDAPLVYDWNGYHPQVAPEKLYEYGYRVVVCSLLATRATMLSVYDRARQLEADGLSVTFDMMEEFDDLDRGFDEFAGFPTALEWERKYGAETSTGNPE